MREFTYLDFDLLIERLETDYRVRVLASPAGETRPVSFQVPFSDLEVENFLLRIGRPRRNVRRIDAPQESAIKDFGARLFESVFPAELRVKLASSLIRADAGNAGLRIRLRFSDSPELSELPWEYLYDREHNRFLTLSDRTPLVRYLEVSDPVRVLPVTPPLRILVVIASPSDWQQLDGEKEWRNVTTSLNDLIRQGRVEVERLAVPTLSALQRQLRRDTYHIFHFIGHGGFDQHSADGMLAMEDEHGRARLVAGEDLGTLLHDHRSLRLAVLNSCEGARADRSDPFSGTAQSLVQQGIPAVMAMQFEITDDAAITFGHVLYEAIADGYPLDAATAEARKAIYAEGNWTEWGTPVLYLRAPDGHIFDIQDRPTPILPPPEAEQQALREAEEQARREADEQARRDAAEQTRRDAAEQARRDAAEQTRRDAAEQARRDAAEQTRRDAAEQTRREAAEQTQRDAAEQTQRDAEEQARREAAEQARTGGLRAVIVLGLTGVAVVLIIIMSGISSLGGGKPRGGSTQPSGPAPPPSTTPAALPRSRPLTDNELIVPMQVKGNWDLYLADSATGKPSTRLTKNKAADYNPALSPDFATVIYLHDTGVNDETRTLRVAGAADGKGDRELFSPVPSVCAGGWMNRPAWNPADPTILAIPCTNKNDAWGLYLIKTDGTVIRQVASDQQRVDDPTFSPDGSQLAFWGGPLSGFWGGNLYVASGDGTRILRMLTRSTLGGQDADPAWSPDGEWIAFRRRVVDGTTGGNQEVYLIRADGKGKPKRLTTSPADEQDPAWSRLGDLIAYKSAAKTDKLPGKPIARAWIMRTDGSQKRVLWTADNVQTTPAWSRR